MLPVALSILVIQFLLGGIFLISSLTKIAAPGRFATNVKQYRVLPGPLATAFGYALPYVEATAALALISGHYGREAAVVIATLLTVFMIAVGAAMARRIHLSCSCFGLLYEERVGWSTLARDAVLLGMALGIMVFGGDELGPPVLLDTSVSPMYVGRVAGALVTVLLAGYVGYLSFSRGRSRGHGAVEPI